MATLSNNTSNDKSMNGLVTIDANSISTDELDVDTLVVNLSATAPTVSALSNDTNIATTAWVNNHASGLYVTLAGASQIISSEKIFTNTFTYITGNLVTNNILSVTPTTDINIGQNLTTGDIFMGTSASTNVALNWGSSSNGGILTFRGGTFNFFATGLLYLRSGATFDTNIADTQTSGILNLGQSSSRTGAINIGSLTTGNAPITIGSSGSTSQTATHNALTTFNKLVVVTDGIIQRWGSSTTGLTLGKTGVNEITAKLLDSLDTLYFNGSTGANIMYLNSTEIVNSIPTTFSSTTTHTGTATFNNNILIQQSTYPSTNTSQLGYTLTVAGSAGNTTTNVWKTLNQIDVPSKGVWLFVGLYELDVVAGQPGDIEQLRFGLSSVAPVSFTRVSNIEYYREADDTVSLNDIRDRLQVSGVFTTLASATYYFSARLRYTGFSATDLQTKGNSTLTRIG